MSSMEPPPLQHLLNTVQLIFGAHHSREVVQTVFDADSGRRDFILMSGVLWELMSEVRSTNNAGRCIV